MAEDNAEDDYLTMVIEEPTQKKIKETYTQRRERLAREAEAKRPKSKAVLAEEAAALRDKELSTKLDETNKGYKMLKMMGFKEGMALGKAKLGGEAITEPIRLDFSQIRGGIGLDTERKRAFEEEVDRQVKRTKERIRMERESSRLEALVFAAQKVAEKFDTDAAEDEWNASLKTDLDVSGKALSKTKPVLPTSRINVLWRGLVRSRELKERERRARHDLIQSLSSLPTYEDDEKDLDDKIADGTLEEDVEEEDAELDEFNAQIPDDRLEQLIEYLRKTYNYCFWCKYRYPDKDMDGCPGTTEEDHD
jgi:hypothetical protein